MTRPSGSAAVMARRLSPAEHEGRRGTKRKVAQAQGATSNDTDPRAGLDYFPTPPWATRALFEHVLTDLPGDFAQQSVWEPCCGEGHMAAVLAEYFGEVYASDVYPHGYGDVGTFVATSGLALGDVARYRGPGRPRWLITNPPFMLAHEMLERAIAEVDVGVAFLLRTAFLESERRFEIFGRFRPHLVAQFSERVPMVQYVWDPEASSATAYAWFVFLKAEVEAGRPNDIRFPVLIIPPGCRRRLTRPGDVARWGKSRRPAPLLEGL